MNDCQAEVAVPVSENGAQAALHRLEGLIQFAEELEARLCKAMDYVTGPVPQPTEGKGTSANPPAGLLGAVHCGLDMMSRRLQAVSSNISRLERVIG